MAETYHFNGLDYAVPRAVLRLPTESRGFRVPFVTLVDHTTGAPDFRVLDVKRQQRCVVEKLCGICGVELGRWVAFLGGPKSIANRLFTDPGMHRNCAQYSASVCPFISRDSAQYRDIKESDPIHEHGYTIITSELTSDDRRDPDMFLCIARGYEPVQVIGEPLLLLRANEFMEIIKIQQRRPAWGI